MNSKKKSRGGGNTMGRGERGQGGSSSNNSKQSKSPDKEPISQQGSNNNKEPSPSESSEFEGIYRNARVTWALTTLIGCKVRVETRSREVFEGILTTFSHELDVVLEQAHKVLDNPDMENYNWEKNYHEKFVMPLGQVTRYYVDDVDLEFATKESFLTDTQISQTRMNGDSGMRELEVWQPEDGDGCLAIEEEECNGWSANEMFAKNEERFGVKTSYDPTLSGYTTQLNRDKLDSEVERQAARIAADIEGETGSKYNAELENGDEEEAFSAVIRPSDRRNGRERESPGEDKPAAYIPPNKREGGGRGGYSRGRGGQRPGGYDNSYDDREHRNNRDRYGGNRSRDSYDRGHDRGGDQRGYYDRNSHRDDRGYSRQDSHGKKDDYRYSDGGGRDMRDRGDRGDKYRGGGDRPGSSADSRRDDRKSIEKVSPLPPHNLERQKSGDRNRSPANGGSEGGHGVAEALPQREGGRRKQEKSKDQIKEEMRDFHNNFNLKISGAAGEDHPQHQQQQHHPQHSSTPQHQKSLVSPNTPTVSINAGVVDQVASGHDPSAGASPRQEQQHGGRPSTSPRGGGEQRGPPPTSGGDVMGVRGGSSPRTDVNNKMASASNTPKQSPAPGSQQAGTPGSQGPPPAGQTPAGMPPAGMPPQGTPAPPTGLPPHSTPTPESAAKKSSLNPNAKEFTLNPSAKEFTPSKSFMAAPRPSPTPPRAQTPVQNMNQIYHNLIPVQAQPLPHQMVSVPLTSTQQQRPLRPNSKEGGGLRAELAAGPPIIAQHPSYYPPGAAGTAGAPQQIHYMHAAPAPHGQTQIMRMQMVPPGMMSMPNMMPVPISQHAGTPGQMTGQQGGLPPGGGEAQAGGGPVPPGTIQSLIPSSQHYQASPGQGQQGQPQQVQHMWNQQVISTPSPMHPPSGAPPPGQVAGVPPQNTMTATPPNPGGQGGAGSAAAPSPGPQQIIGYPPGQGPHMILMPAPQFHPQTHGQAPGMPGAPGAAAAAGQLLPGQPAVTSLPGHAQGPYQLMPGAGQPAFHVVGQAPPHPQ